MWQGISGGSQGCHTNTFVAAPAVNDWMCVVGGRLREHEMSNGLFVLVALGGWLQLYTVSLYTVHSHIEFPPTPTSPQDWGSV